MTHQCKGVCKNGQRCKKQILKAEYCKIHYEGECSICISNIRDCKSKRTSCGHFFHESCLEEWLNRDNTCPICRTEIGKHKHYIYEMRVTPDRSNPITYELHLSQNIHNSSPDDMISALVDEFVELIRDDEEFGAIISNHESFEVHLIENIS